MKRIKKFVMIGLLLAVGMASVPKAHAKSLKDLQVAELDKINAASRRVIGNMGAMKMFYVGSATAAVLGIEHLRIIAYAPQFVPDSNFGTSGIYQISDAAYDTFGELCDAVDALTDYECDLTDGKRDQNSNQLRDQVAADGTNDLKAVGGFEIQQDTGGAYDVADEDVFKLQIGITPNVGRRVLLKECKANINVIDTFKVYGKERKKEGASDGVTRDDTTNVWNTITADDTDLTTTFSVNGLGGLEFGKDEHVVITGGDGGTGVQAAANFLECKWEEK